MKYDFHTHSTVSDGSLSPTEMVKRAKLNGVYHYSLTDHDDFSGYFEAKKVADSMKINLISGVEVSTTWCDNTIHLLGYGFNVDDQLFNTRLADIRNTRIERADKIGQALEKLGFANALKGAQEIAGREHPISRTHFARYMIKMGYVKNFADSMNKFLADGKPASVLHHWVDIPTAIEWIHQAGGVAFLAHPLRYRFNQGADLEDLISEFARAGGDGLEVVYARHTTRQIDYLTEFAIRYNLAASGGSDFHTDEPTMGGVEIGNICPIPNKLIPLTKVLGIN